jgi:hypothetical protein
MTAVRALCVPTVSRDGEQGPPSRDFPGKPLVKRGGSGI